MVSDYRWLALVVYSERQIKKHFYSIFPSVRRHAESSTRLLSVESVDESCSPYITLSFSGAACLKPPDAILPPLQAHGVGLFCVR